MDKKKLSLKEIGAPKLIILFLTGIFLIFLSVSDLGKGKEEQEAQTIEPEVKEAANQNTDEKYSGDIEKYESKLKNMLEKVSGAGRVEVMITQKSSAEQVVLKDTPYKQSGINEADSEGGTRISSNIEKEDTTVLVKGENGENVPFITKELSAQIEGVLVIAEGGANGTVAANIVAAVEALFDVPVHKITVLPMENNE